jgi:phage terminase large subunit-like protein
LKPELLRAGFSERMIETTFVEFRQGHVTMTPALRALEGLLLDKKIRHGGNPILTMCASNAVIEGDATARKLSKKRSSGRIDGLVALTMAIGVAPSGFTTKFDAAALIG